MEEVLVGFPRRRELDDLALLPHAANLHGEAFQRCSAGKRDPEPTLEGARLGIVEREAELGEGDGSVDDGLGGHCRESQPGTVRGSETQQGLGLYREADGRSPDVEIAGRSREPQRRGGGGGRRRARALVTRGADAAYDDADEERKRSESHGAPHQQSLPFVQAEGGARP